MDAGDRGGIPLRGPVEQPMRTEDLLDRPDELNATCGEDHEVVADALELGDDV